MNFAVLPPEVTSAQMYTGAGSGPMLAAAASWSGLGDELGSAADSFSSVTSGLAGGPWQGPASAAMAAVATQYAQWLNASAAQAASAAAQANATAASFETARAAIAHPAAVTGNRMQLLSLVRSNLFGFNAPAIAATEGAYESMWAQNVAALSGYHGAASAAAAQLSEWSDLPVPQVVATPPALVPVVRAATTIARVLPAKMLAAGVQLDAEGGSAVEALQKTVLPPVTAAAGDFTSAAQGLSSMIGTDTGSSIDILAGDLHSGAEEIKHVVATITGSLVTPTPTPTPTPPTYAP